VRARSRPGKRDLAQHAQAGLWHTAPMDQGHDTAAGTGDALRSVLGLRRPRPGFGDRQFLLLLAAGVATAAPLGWWTAPSAGAARWSLLLAVMVYYPVMEELLFRGALQGALLRYGCWSRRSLAGISGANLITSAAFCTLHLVHQPAPWALAVFAPSLAFGYVRERQHSLLGSLVLHSMWNGSFFLARLASSGVA